MTCRGGGGEWQNFTCSIFVFSQVTYEMFSSKQLLNMDIMDTWNVLYADRLNVAKWKIVMLLPLVLM